MYAGTAHNIFTFYSAVTGCKLSQNVACYPYCDVSALKPLLIVSLLKRTFPTFALYKGNSLWECQSAEGEGRPRQVQDGLHGAGMALELRIFKVSENLPQFGTCCTPL